MKNYTVRADHEPDGVSCPAHSFKHAAEYVAELRWLDGRDKAWPVLFHVTHEELGEMSFRVARIRVLRFEASAYVPNYAPAEALKGAE